MYSTGCISIMAWITVSRATRSSRSIRCPAAPSSSSWEQISDKAERTSSQWSLPAGDAGGGDHVLPFDDVGLDAFDDHLRRAGLRIDALDRQRLLSFRRGHRRQHRGIEPLDDVG